MYKENEYIDKTETTISIINHAICKEKKLAMNIKTIEPTGTVSVISVPKILKTEFCLSSGNPKIKKVSILGLDTPFKYPETKTVSRRKYLSLNNSILIT